MYVICEFNEKSLGGRDQRRQFYLHELNFPDPVISSAASINRILILFVDPMTNNKIMIYNTYKQHDIRNSYINKIL